MGASQITKPIVEPTPVTATVAEGLLEEANVSAWRAKKTCRDRNKQTNKCHEDLESFIGELAKRTLKWPKHFSNTSISKLHD